MSATLPLSLFPYSTEEGRQLSEMKSPQTLLRCIFLRCKTSRQQTKGHFDISVSAKPTWINKTTQPSFDEKMYFQYHYF